MIYLWTYIDKTQAFAIINPALWNQLPLLTCFSLLTGQPSASFCSLKIVFLSESLALEALLIRVHCWKQALYKFIDTI